MCPAAAAAAAGSEIDRAFVLLRVELEVRVVARFIALLDLP